MSKTQSLASAFGSIATTLGKKSGGKAVVAAPVKRARKSPSLDDLAGSHFVSQKSVDAKAERAANREMRLATKEARILKRAERQGVRAMRVFAKNLKTNGVRRLRFLPFGDIVTGGATFKLGGKIADRVAELQNFYAAEGSLKTVRLNKETETTVIRLNYTKTSRVEIYSDRGAVFFA